MGGCKVDRIAIRDDCDGGIAVPILSGDIANEGNDEEMSDAANTA